MSEARTRRPDAFRVRRKLYPSWLQPLLLTNTLNTTRAVKISPPSSTRPSPRHRFDGSVVTGRVLRLTDEFAIVDVGLKSEGRVALKEFGPPGAPAEVKPGDLIELFVERYEDRDGSIVLSREKARREEAWTALERRRSRRSSAVNGTIYGRVKGGFTVDLGGAVAFLPGSQVDIRPVRDVGPLMGVPQPFQILKMDRARGNIVVSRRAVLEETRAEQRSELIQA